MGAAAPNDRTPERLNVTVGDATAAERTVEALVDMGVDPQRVETSPDGVTASPTARDDAAPSPDRGRGLTFWSAVLGAVAGAVLGGMFILPVVTPDPWTLPAVSQPWVVALTALVGLLVGAGVGQRLRTRGRGDEHARPAGRGIRVGVRDVTPEERPQVEAVLRQARRERHG